MGTLLLHMAVRNVLRNRRRTAIVLAGFAFGIMFAVVFTAIADDTYGRMVELAARLGGGHVTIQHRDALDQPAADKSLPRADRIRDRVVDVEGVEAAVVRIRAAAMIATARESAGTVLLGIDPAVETPATLSLLEAVAEGEVPAAEDRRGVVLGDGLADHLGAGVGKKVVVTVTDAEGEVASALGKVRGLIDTGAESVDKYTALAGRTMLASTLGYASDEASLVAVFLEHPREVDEAVLRIRAELADVLPPDAAVLPWYEVQPDLAAYIQLDSSGLVVFEVLLLLLIAAGVFNTLLVSVMERTREFGIMMAVGHRPADVFRLVVLESVVLSVMGLVAGALVTILPYWYLHTYGFDMSSLLGVDSFDVTGVAVDPIMRANIVPIKLAIIGAIVVVATVAAGLYPAYRAARIEPVEAIRLV
ncbi:MAG: ABC transporter permease [Deltaproteobacteria bacterium]|nr:MAG: ABC transporter permease [Deltaproteobacteria bacterium]